MAVSSNADQLTCRYCRIRITNLDDNQHCQPNVALPVGFKTMEDLTLSTTMSTLPYLNFIQQLTELQRENIELWKEGFYDWSSWNNYVRKPERSTITLD